jgi:xanthine dehydrogenase accessory factor
MHRFESRGIAAATLARKTCPIGLPAITGKEPEVIAAAVVAQLLQVCSSADQASASALSAPTSSTLTV